MNTSKVAMRKELMIKPTIYLYFVEEFNYEEISCIQQVSMTSIKNIVTTVIKEVQTILGIQDKKIAKAMITAALLYEMQQSIQSEEYSQRMYHQIMKRIHNFNILH